LRFAHGMAILQRHEMPPLPRLSEALSEQVFTHKGLHGGAYSAAQTYLTDPTDNERLTWLGAAALQVAVARRLYERFPRRQVGFLTQERAGLISSATLAEWSHAYGLPSRLRAHVSALELLKRNPKVAAGIFEAYVGGLLEYAGPEAVSSWVAELVDAQLTKNGVTDEPEPSSPGGDATEPGPSAFIVASTSNALSMLNEKATQRGAKITWEEESFGPQHNRHWRVKLFIDGRFISDASADQKKSAKHTAADKAWETLQWR